VCYLVLGVDMMLHIPSARFDTPQRLALKTKLRSGTFESGPKLAHLRVGVKNVSVTKRPNLGQASRTEFCLKNRPQGKVSLIPPERK
jgi:hypothetical protein